MSKTNKYGKNANDPDYNLEERPYYDDKKEKEEMEKVPVEYLAYLQKRKGHRIASILFWIVFWLVVLGLGPGFKSQEYCCRSGELRNHFTFAWGHLDYIDLPRPTDWTDWYAEKSPERFSCRWLPWGKTYPALFGYITLPFGTDLGWDMPDNLVQRMKELDDIMRTGQIMDIPRVLSAVNNSVEWNVIIIPLTLGSPEEALQWWNDHKNELLDWSNMELGTPLPDTYKDAALTYIAEMEAPDGNVIPLYK